MSTKRPGRVVILAPMPLEMEAIASAFGLRPDEASADAAWTGAVRGIAVSAFHIGMGPARAREATARIVREARPGGEGLLHVMIAGICGGLDPDLPVGTVIKPETVVDQPTGISYRHHPPGTSELRGKLITTETVSFDSGLSHSLFLAGGVAVDMESAAVAEVCEAGGVPWSVHRCISDRHFDGLLDPRVVALANPDGTSDPAALEKLLTEEPEIVTRLERLGRDSAVAARLAAEDALDACRELGS